MGSLEVQTSTGLDSLPPRPPTPPREACHEPAASARIALAAVDRHLNLQTPPSIYSPADSVTTNSGSASNRKRVGFSARAEYKDAPVYPEGNVAKAHQPTPVSLPPSSSKPVKSILKVTTYAPNPLDPISASTAHQSGPNEDISTMLESAIQHLAGSNRDSKVDAYMVLTQALKTTNNLPDRAALQEQIGFFAQCIQRDVTAKTPEGTLDSSLVNHALSLLSTVIYFPSIAAAIPHEFAVFIIDHCIRTFEDSTSPKESVRHLMHVVGHQKFSQKVMTADRVARLISSLHNIEEHLKGKSIIMARVLIYRQLLRNCRSHMVVNSDWLLDLFTDMLSSLKEIRSAAIQLGLEAGFSTGKDKQLARKVADIFSLMLEDKTYLKYYEERLEVMAKDKTVSASVPRIWTAVILLLRMPMDKWEASKNWLRIIQSCFNSSDLQTKTEANYAWGRLIYLAHFEERSFPKNVITLRQPLETQLRRKPTGKKEEEIRRAVLGGICNLFYYEFKPTTNLALLDAYWDNGVDPLLTKLLDPKPEDSQERLGEASKILAGLFDCTTKRVWKEERVIDNVIVRPEELPPIDSKWLRRNASRVFALVGPILEQTFLALADSKSVTSRLWETLVASVASAASKEIKVSPDTASFVAHAFNAMHKIWQRGLLEDDQATSGSAVFLSAMERFLAVMIQSLGPLPFTEKILAVSKETVFVPVATPSSRPTKNQGPSKSPLHHLFSVLSSLPPGVADDGTFSQFIIAAFDPFFPGKDEQVDKNLAQELLSTIPMDALSPYGPWQLAAEWMQKWLEPKLAVQPPSGSGSQPLAGNDYREAIKVLERGLRSTPNLPWDLWQRLFACLARRAQAETGDAGVAIAVIEPLARVAFDLVSSRSSSRVADNTTKSVVEILSTATQPRDRQAVDAARRRLWGTPNAGPKSASFDTFDNLYKVVDAALMYSYSEFDAANVKLAGDLLEEVGTFVGRCNPELTTKTLAALQGGVSVWIQDEGRQLGSQSSPSLAAVKSVWAALSQALIKIQPLEQQLGHLERLFCAVFGSSHRTFVNSAAALWNAAFKDVGNIQYPEKLQPILVSLQQHIELILPGLETTITEASAQLSFADSQEEAIAPEPISSRPSRRSTPRSSSRHSKSPLPSTRVVPGKRHLESTSITKAPKAKRRSTTPRLRHDDSQIAFAPIDSSPTTDHEVESQLLTEHQKEVRERQKQNEALFPALRSSPGTKTTEISAAEPTLPSQRPKSPELPGAATPEPEGRFDNYVASTPTPRRGQLVALPEIGNDLPSSPPEPRGNPLADEIRSRSASNSIRDEWQEFSSSPITGSPNAVHHAGPFTPSRRTTVAADIVLPGAEEPMEMDDVADAVGLDEDELPILDSEDEVIEDSLIITRSTRQRRQAASNVLDAAVPSTPKLQQRPTGQPEETPKSGDEVFMDAFASPQAATPGRLTRSSRAMAKKAAQATRDACLEAAIADGKKHSKLVVELANGNVDPGEYEAPPSSANDQAVQDAIVVGGTPKRSRRTSSRRAKSSPLRPTIPATQAEESRSQSTQSKSRAGQKKRKRGSSAKAADQGIEGSKKPRHHESANELDEVPDSQLAIPDQDVSMVEEVAAPPGRISSPAGREESPDLSVGPIEAVLAVDPAPAEMEVQVPVEEERDETIDKPDAELAVAAPHAEGAETGGEKMAVVLGKQETAELVAVESNVKVVDIVQEIKSQLMGAMAALRSASLAREEVYKIEDLMMDFKRELFEAERRGRT
ncbi:hypothetical protein GQ53DRAFT_709930 [Thozetella sp. PMI_491]|nr:hypothetical protein GQ53DRAFT_709930 [Thozetella sp. PMI_491]